MELKEREPGNLTDKIVELMSEANTNAEADIHTEPLNRPMLQAEAELMLKPEPTNRPAPDRECIYETPYSTHIYRNYGGSRVTLRNSSNDQSRNGKWSLSRLIIGLVIGLVIGATVTGLSMHFTKTPACATLSTASPMVTAAPSTSTELGESTSLLLDVDSMIVYGFLTPDFRFLVGFSLKNLNDNDG